MAVESVEVLHLIFTDRDGKTRAVKVPDPKEDLTEEQISEVMDKLIEKDVLAHKFISKKGAKVVETLTEEFDITVE